MNNQIKGYLLDLDGVIYSDNCPIEGAVETLHRLKEQKIPYRFITNTSTKSVDTLHHTISSLGIPVFRNEIFSSPSAAKLYLRQQPSAKCFFILREDVQKDFQEFTICEEKPDFVVLGDIGSTWNYQILNDIFHKLINGARLLALHKCKYWQVAGELQMDIGAFVAGLEYVSGQNAIVIGKPSPFFFNLAVQDMGLKPTQVAMVGDDIDSDIDGAQSIGIRGILVKTGQYREKIIAKSSVVPDMVIDSIASLGC